ncbi:outer membrane lipid asymmetry maintenance protein MlaD [Shewanella sp. 1_MG-2023]|jgi:phospholipid/cholesterol/gamma-HCH transport system substrate-binding protein|uniref:Outer membrane lipid asymmetry maintenance protein MlaD n=1 Tax=Shewanella electrodiphila TaxID=934143 RepID=A0ABT0KPL8_9GAMM|nr:MULTISPECIES: outer membrane lipid asymmetry maintenance protein MlaD [Shewanella]MCC4834061.1 outer membrane lipid asymmetry maintenance protein MlaD [Shewanella sp. 10N.7]MCL1045724.1 outer membrane lipid asymmetry maintenance protein MlaD [Shewanella electrodiphila]MDO6613493.1 outer membrane lipid asymmetry maintenance protein MlaD [Shewanella sp. 7_MG-2023]MDO6773323.1 outer membrane lipid asymmetry maintenance protein MlaD [Shewanella sp. 2_MG-2023]MDO6795974.1 outer membrane lipid as
MLTRKVELFVGLFLLTGLLAFCVLVFNVANVELKSSKETYTLRAEFNNIGGLKVRSPVKVGGVVVGRVSKITLDNKKLVPVVTLTMDKEFNQFPETSSLSILTSGLLGEQFLGLTPGFMDDDIEMLADGDRVHDTRSALILEDLIGQLLYSVSSKDN